MNPHLAPEHSARLEEFSRRHRVGLLTVLFTDIVESTRIKRIHGDARAVRLIQGHHAVVRQTLSKFGEAREIETAGDSFLLVFARPSEAVKFSLQLHLELKYLARETGVEIFDRVGVHLGEVFIQDHAESMRLFGSELDLCARVMSLGGASQILMTHAVFDHARSALRGQELEGIGPLRWFNHGPYLLKGIEEPVDICEVRIGTEGQVTPPTSSEKAQRVAGDGESVLGWRPAAGQMVPNTNWVLEEKLGEGGFGEVWKARHQKLDEARVFKFCFRFDRVRSLKREVTLFRLVKQRMGDHPNIVKLHDIYLDTAPYYVEEEYIPGRDLKNWCERNGGLDNIPLDWKVECIAQAADGLQAAHDAGVIHRDLKPTNILVGSSTPAPGVSISAGGEHSKWTDQSFCSIPVRLSVKLADFGIGQVVSAEYLNDLTRSGFTVTVLASDASPQQGTHLYMAPELLAGREASTRSDIYSLGVVLYQLVVGDFTKPVTTDWANGISDPLLHEDLTRCFAGNPQERFGSAGQLAINLRALPHRRNEAARQQAERLALEQKAYRRGVRRTISVAATIITALVALLFYAIYERQHAARSAAREARQRQLAEQRLYVANINRAQQALEAGNPERAQQLLDMLVPEPGQPDLRGFEWRLFRQQSEKVVSRVLDAHRAHVEGAAFSPNGKWLATGGTDGTARIWDAETGQPVTTLNGFKSGVRKLDFSPDGSTLIVGCNNGTLHFWRVNPWREITSLKAHAGMFDDVKVAPDGRFAATAGDDHIVKLWDAAQYREMGSFRGHTDEVWRVAFAPHAPLLASSGADKTVRLWELPSGRPLAVFVAAEHGISGLAFSPDGKLLATGAVDEGELKLWDAATHKLVATMAGHSSGIFSIAFSPDGKIIASASDDRTIKLWGTSSHQLLVTLRRHGFGVHVVAFSPDSMRLASGSTDCTALLWDLHPRPQNLVLESSSKHFFWGAAFSPDGRTLGTMESESVVGTEPLIKLWDVSGFKVTATLTVTNGNVHFASFSPDSRVLATCHMGGRVMLHDLSSGQKIGGFDSMIHWPLGVSYSPNNALVAIWGREPKVVLFDVTSYRPVGSLQGCSSNNLYGVQMVQFLPDNRRLATLGIGEHTVELWEPRSRRRVGRIGGAQRGSILCFSCSPHTPLLAVGGQDSYVQLWDGRTIRQINILKGHAAPVSAVAFSVDGKTLVSGSLDGTIKVWSLSLGEEVATFKGASAEINSLCFSPDQNLLVASAREHRIRVWVAGPYTDTLNGKSVSQ